MVSIWKHGDGNNSRWVSCICTDCKKVVPKHIAMVFMACPDCNGPLPLLFYDCTPRGLKELRTKMQEILK